MCRNCGRPLHALRAPRCNWCGAAVPAADFEAVAGQSRHVMALPTPGPLPSVSSYAQWADLGWRRPSLTDLFLPRVVQQFRPTSPGQARLRVAVFALFGLLAAVKTGYLLYTFWELHRVMQTFPH